MDSTRTPAELAEWDQCATYFRERLDVIVADARVRLAAAPRDQVGSELGHLLSEHVHPMTVAAVLMVAVLRLAEVPPAAPEGGVPGA